MRRWKVEIADSVLELRRQLAALHAEPALSKGAARRGPEESAARAALADGLNDAGSVKRATRIGMGPCQGRYCRPLLEALIQEATGKAPDETSGFAPRPPFRPVTIRDLAGKP